MEGLIKGLKNLIKNSIKYLSLRANRATLYMKEKYK